MTQETAEVRGQETEDGGQETEDGGQETEDGLPAPEQLQKYVIHIVNVTHSGRRWRRGNTQGIKGDTESDGQSIGIRVQRAEAGRIVAPSATNG